MTGPPQIIVRRVGHGYLVVSGRELLHLEFQRRDEVVVEIEGGGDAILMRLPDDRLHCEESPELVALFR